MLPAMLFERRPATPLSLYVAVSTVLVGGVLGLSASQVPSAAAAKPGSLGAGARSGKAGGKQPRAGTAAGCGNDMVLVERTCVDRYEGHLLVKKPDGSLERHPPHQRPEGDGLIASSAPGVKPQAFISRHEAAAACGNAGKRLCKLEEWYRACTGKARTLYPYGKSYEAKRCNVGKPHLLSMLHGANASGWSYADFNDRRLATTDGFLALTGQYAGCASTEGVHDMVGNLHEWVDDLVDRSLPRKLPVEPIIERRIGRNTGNGIFMGGFFSTRNEHGEGCTYTTAAHGAGYHDYSTGFRCCRDAPSD
jgi:formylglycine-generating enzyme